MGCVVNPTVTRESSVSFDPADRVAYEPGQVTQCDLWFPEPRIPVGAGVTPAASSRTHHLRCNASSGFRLSRSSPTRPRTGS